MLQGLGHPAHGRSGAEALETLKLTHEGIIWRRNPPAHQSGSQNGDGIGHNQGRTRGNAETGNVLIAPKTHLTTT